MSATEEKGNNNDEETALNEDLVNLNTETRSVSEVQDITPTISSDTIGAMSKIIPQSPSNITEEHIDKESGDNKVEKVTENLINIDKKKQEPLLDSGKGSGDHTTISQPDSSTIDDETSLIEKKEESLMDVSADITDADEMELKWDYNDDDKSPVNDDILLEEQLLQDDTSNTEGSKNVAKDTEIIDENVLEETDTNTKDKSVTDVTKDNKEIDKVNSPLQETENNKDTVNIDNENNDEIAKVDTAESPNKDSMDKTEDVILEASDTENVVLENEKEVNKDLSQEVDIKMISEDPKTGDKLGSTDTEKNKMISDDDLNKDRDEDLQEIVDNSVTSKFIEPVLDDPKDDDDKEEVSNSPETKIPDPEMNVSMDNIEDVNEEELLKDDENVVLGDDENQDKIDDKLLKDDENQVEGDAGPSVDDPKKIVKDIPKNDENQIIGDNRPSVDDEGKTSDKLLKDDENQDINYQNQDKIDDEFHKDDGIQDKIGKETPKDDENQVMDEDGAVVDDQNIKSDKSEITTDLDVVKPSVEDQIKMGDDINKKNTDLNEVVKEKVDKTPSTSLTVVPSDESKTSALDKFEKAILLESTKNTIKEKILDAEDRTTTERTDPKTEEKILTEVLTGDLTKDTKIDDKNKELSNITPKTPENIPVVVNSEITNTVENIQEEEITKNDNSKVIDLEDSPIHKKPHSLHKPDVMLEIPSQEFIDIDAELSINLDQLPASPKTIDKAEDIDVFEDSNKGLVEQVEGREGKDTGVLDEKDKLVKESVVLDNKEKDEQTKDTVVLDNKDTEIKDSIVLDKDKAIKDTVIQETVEEGMERIFSEDPVVKETECIATTSTANAMASDTTDLQEMTDSLGLLAESVRVRDDEGDAVDDDDDDDDHYESSNQVSPYQSDDSNAPTDSDAVRQQEKEIDSPDVKEDEFEFLISNVESTTEEKLGEMEVKNTEIDGAIDEKSKESVLLKNGEESNEEQIEESLDQEQQMDIDTVKLSDTSDSEKEQTELSQSQMKERDEKTPEREQNTPPSKTPSQSSPFKQSPSIKKLEIKTLQPNQIVNIVDLQESSSSEDESQQSQETEDIPVSLPPSPDQSVTTVNIPSGIEVMACGGTTSEMVSKKGEIVVSGVPKPKPHPPARLNTSEVTIKTVCHVEPMVIPETTLSQLPPETQVKSKLGLEIFNLDSDDEDNVPQDEPQSPTKQATPENRKPIKCMNYSCTSGTKVPFIVADARVMAFYETGRKRRTMVCQSCADAVYERAQNLIDGIKNFTPLLDLQLGNHSHDLVISDSESEEDEEVEPASEWIDERTASYLQENLTNIFNEIWMKYNLETRLEEAQITLEDEMDQIERDTKDLDKAFDDCQQATDTQRRELYATFQVQREELPPLTIVDMPGLKFIGRGTNQVDPMVRADKRRKPTVNEQPAKRPAIPLGYAPLEDTAKDKIASEIKLDEDKDISVVRLSMELAPADLPPPGSISRPPLRVGMPVYAMKNAFGPWLKGKILEIQPRVANTPNSFSLCRVKFDHKTKTNAKILPARCVAYAEPSDVRMTIGTRLIALFKDSNKRESYYSGVVAEIPNPVNSYRYLVFFDDGYAQYVHHPFTRLVCESSPLVWEEVHPFSREFVMEYLLKYPERPMVRLHEGQHLKTEWNGKWWPSRVNKVDASLAQVMFVGDGRREWVYRGSTRLAPLYLALRAAERHRPRPMPRSKAQPGSNMPYVEYTRSDEPETNKQLESQAEQQSEEIRNQRAVAKKSTAPHIPPPRPEVLKLNTSDATTKDNRVVHYTPKNAVRPYKMSPHRCGPHCKRSDVLTLNELRTYNPLAKPLLSGWERQLVRFKGQREVMYRAPCGRRLRNMNELHHYLRLINCELPVDLFDFNPMTHCLAEYVTSKCLVGKKDLSHGKENVPVPCVNYFDESLPEFCSYNTERTPTAGVPLNLDPEFLCGCDCTDDCADKEKCACWRMTLEGAKTIGLEGSNVGYVYKRLPEPLPSGIYECNSRCKCKDTCLNRVAQHPLQLKLQVFKTENRGWGIRALNDVPKGSFLCVYAGNLLTDATANLDGLNEGDEYLAELDYIEVVEQMKEGYEEDIPEADKKLDKKELKQDDDDDDDESESSSSEEDDTSSKTDKEDDDFRPGYIGLGVMEFNKRLRRRSSKKVKEEPAEENGEKDASTDKSQEKKENADEDCITISDDEEVREPSSFTVKAGMGANDFVSKYRSVRSYFGEDEACYIMDAKVQGNIGRYLNHSCCPNVFVQNVFVDTHDPRFPWVAFFALSHIKAGGELTWNYNYDVGSVPGKVLYCYCSAPNCRGRLL